MKIQYWLNEVFIIGYNYHIKKGQRLKYALEFVAGGLIRKNHTRRKHHFIVHSLDFDITTFLRPQKRVFIHPYMDGNGRIGRFLMNVMLAAGGYPWTVIPLEKRDDYMNALENGSAEQDITPYAIFLGRLVSESR